MRWAALLKGLNIGGKRMAAPELKAVVERLGYADATTLLASGNIVFTADEADGAALEARIAAALAERGLDTEVLVRNAAEMRAVIAANPFPDAAAARPNHLTVTFHRAPVPAGPLTALADTYHGPERLHADGRELYIDHPDGIGTSKLPPAMAKAKFPPIATARNWNTLVKLADLLG